MRTKTTMKADFVLIETTWNVKVDISDMPADFPNGINRNIVECKAIYMKVEFYCSPVLIETSWNVK